MFASRASFEEPFAHVLTTQNQIEKQWAHVPFYDAFSGRIDGWPILEQTYVVGSSEDENVSIISLAEWPTTCSMMTFSIELYCWSGGRNWWEKLQSATVECVSLSFVIFSSQMDGNGLISVLAQMRILLKICFPSTLLGLVGDCVLLNFCRYVISSTPCCSQTLICTLPGNPRASFVVLAIYVTVPYKMSLRIQHVAVLLQW